jgi:hypothetical protein
MPDPLTHFSAGFAIIPLNTGLKALIIKIE